MRSLAMLLILAPLVAAQPTPAGTWRTIDDVTGKVKSLVVITDENGHLSGRIEKVINPAPDNPDKKCIHCDGALHDKPLEGLTIFTGLKKDGDQWEGGKILDPDNGKYYRCYLQVLEGGKKLKVRGYIGFSVFGRTQYWLREK